MAKGAKPLSAEEYAERWAPLAEAYWAMEHPDMATVAKQFGISRERVRQIITRIEQESPIRRSLAARREFIRTHAGEMSSAEMAEHFAVSPKTILHDANRLGVSLRITPYDHLTKEEVVEAYDGSIYRTADRLGLTLGQTQHLLKRFGLRLRRTRGTFSTKQERDKAMHDAYTQRRIASGVCRIPGCWEQARSESKYCQAHAKRYEWSRSA